MVLHSRHFFRWPLSCEVQKLTKLLLKLFVKNWENREDCRVRSAIGSFSGILGIVCNSLLSLGKILVGAAAGSLSVIADGINNLTDCGASVVTFAGFRLSERPPDKHHPFGHARFEYLSGLAVAAMILMIGTELLRTSAGKIIHPQAVELTAPMVWVLLLSAAVKVWMAISSRYLGKYIDSGTLLAAAQDSRNDVLATLAVLAGAVLENITGLHLDGVVGLGVSFFILYSGVSLGIETIDPLIGRETDPVLRKKITEIAERDPKVLGHHDLMVHDYGPGQRFGTVHVEMDSREEPLKAHAIIDWIERSCYKELGIHMVVHLDPVLRGDQEQDSFQKLMSGSLNTIDDRLKLHDFRMVRREQDVLLVFDVVLPEDLEGKKQQILDRLSWSLDRVSKGKYQAVVTFDPEGFNED